MEGLRSFLVVNRCWMSINFSITVSSAAMNPMRVPPSISISFPMSSGMTGPSY
jgi:hypothetical protein